MGGRVCSFATTSVYNSNNKIVKNLCPITAHLCHTSKVKQFWVTFATPSRNLYGEQGIRFYNYFSLADPIGK
jgi:hypothetical protein